jgi:ankyrin repeat protein
LVLFNLKERFDINGIHMSLKENNDQSYINSNIDDEDISNIEIIKIEKELLINNKLNNISEISLNIKEEIQELDMNNNTNMNNNNMNNNNNQLSNSYITPERYKIFEYDTNNRNSIDVKDEDRGDLTTLASHHSHHSYQSRQSHNSEYSDVDDSDEDYNDKMNFNNNRNSIDSFNNLNFGSNNSLSSFEQDSLNKQQISPPTLNKFLPPPVISLSPSASPPRNNTKQELGIAADRFPRRSNSMPSLDVPLTNINNDVKPPFSPFSTSSSTTSEMFGSIASPGTFLNDPRVSVSPPIVYSVSPPTVSLPPPPPTVTISPSSTVSISPPLPINSKSPTLQPFNSVTSSSQSSNSPSLIETILPPPISNFSPQMSSSPLLGGSISPQVAEISPNSSISSPPINNTYPPSSQNNYNGISPIMINRNEINSEVNKKPHVSMFIPVVKTSVESIPSVNTTSMFMPVVRTSLESIPSINNEYNQNSSVNVSQSSSVNSYQQHLNNHHQQLQQSPVIIEPVTSSDLPPGWTEYMSEEGWPYYLHDESGESSWDRPVPVVSNNNYEQPIVNNYNGTYCDNNVHDIYNDNNNNYNNINYIDNNNNYNSNVSPVPSNQPSNLSNQSPQFNHQEPNLMYLNVATEQMQSPPNSNQYNNINKNNNNNNTNHYQNQFNNDNRGIDHRFHETSSNGSVTSGNSNKFLANNSNNSNIIAASINANGQSALHISAGECMAEGLDILLKSGIHADIIDGNGHTALQIICNKPYNIQQNRCLTLLIEAGADVNICDSKGDYALHLCVLQGNSESITTLLTAGADSNVVNGVGDTPLHSSAKIGKFGCMQVLVLNNSTGGSTNISSSRIMSPQITSPPQLNTYQQYDHTNSNNKGNNNQYNVGESEQQRAWKQYEAAKNSGNFNNSNYINKSYNELNQSNDMNAWEVESNHSLVSNNSNRRQSSSNVIQSQRYVIKKKSVSNPTNKITPTNRSSSNYPNPNNISSDSEDADTYRDAEDDMSMTSSQYRQKPVVKPKDWVELLSPNGDIYYYNEKEQKVQWENPYPVVPIVSSNLSSNNNYNNDMNYNNNCKTNHINNKMPSSMFETTSNENQHITNDKYSQNDSNLLSNHNNNAISPSSRGGMYTTYTESESTNVIQAKNSSSMRTSTVQGYISGTSSSPAQSPSSSGRGRGRLSQTSPSQQIFQQQPYNQDYPGRITNTCNYSNKNDITPSSPTHSYKQQQQQQQQEYNQAIPTNQEEYKLPSYNQPESVVLDLDMNGNIPYSSPFSTPLKQKQDKNISHSSNDIVSNLDFNLSNDVIDVNDDSLSDLSDDGTQQSISISGASRVSTSVASSSNLNERHLQIWNKFFENVLKSDNGSANNPQRDKYTYDENGKRIKNKGNKGLSVGGFSPTRQRSPRNVWPAKLSDVEYNELLNSVFEANDDDATVYDKKNKALIAAVMRIDLETSELLLLNGANSNCCDIHKRGPAHFASRVGNEFLLALLFDHGADLDAVDTEGRSPIHTASSFGNIDAVRFLLESAISVDSCDSMGNSSIHLAARGNL